MESCSRITDGNGRLEQGEDEVPSIWKEYFQDLYNTDTQEQVAVHVCGFDGVRRRAEVQMRVGKFKNGKAANKDEVTRHDKRWS